MSEDLVTSDLILGWIKNQVEHKNPISPHLWLDVAQKLNILSSEDNDKLIEVESELAQMRALAMTQHGTATAAKIMVESSPRFKEARKLRAKLKQIEEAIRLAKLSARIKSDEMRNSL